MDPRHEPRLTRRQVREVDRIAIEERGIPGLTLMENAGRLAARLILDLTPGLASAAIVCGRGNNGGDGFVIARHLSEAGAAVEVILACDPERLTGDAAANARAVEKLALPCRRFDSAEAIKSTSPHLSSKQVIVDAVLGTGFSGSVRPPLNLAIEAINASGGPTIFAVDLPSGLDCDSGRPSNATVRAHHTITFIARKTGFDAPGAAAFTGVIHVVDIGVPPDVVQAVLAGAEPC